MTENNELVTAIIEGIQEKKGFDIVHVDMNGIETAATRDFVICTGNSSLQVDAIADSVREYVQKKLDTKPLNYDGYQNSQWIIIDYGTVYAHVFNPEFRDRYKLEELWADAKVTAVPNEI